MEYSIQTNQAGQQLCAVKSVEVWENSVWHTGPKKFGLWDSVCEARLWSINLPVNRAYISFVIQSGLDLPCLLNVSFSICPLAFGKRQSGKARLWLAFTDMSGSC